MAHIYNVYTIYMVCEKKLEHTLLLSNFYSFWTTLIKCGGALNSTPRAWPREPSPQNRGGERPGAAGTGLGDGGQVSGPSP